MRWNVIIDFCLECSSYSSRTMSRPFSVHKLSAVLSEIIQIILLVSRTRDMSAEVIVIRRWLCITFFVTSPALKKHNCLCLSGLDPLGCYSYANISSCFLKDTLDSRLYDASKVMNIYTHFLSRSSTCTKNDIRKENNHEIWELESTANINYF